MGTRWDYRLAIYSSNAAVVSNRASLLRCGPDVPLFAPKLPISEEERLWMDNAFQRLDKLVGRRRMVQAKVVLPNAEHFPDPFDQSSASAEALFQRVCLYMGVQRSAIDLEIFPDETEELRSILPYWHGNSSGCAGFYTHENTDGESEASDKRMLVACGVRN